MSPSTGATGRQQISHFCQVPCVCKGYYSSITLTLLQDAAEPLGAPQKALLQHASLAPPMMLHATKSDTGQAQRIVSMRGNHRTVEPQMQNGTPVPKAKPCFLNLLPWVLLRVYPPSAANTQNSDSENKLTNILLRLCPDPSPSIRILPPSLLHRGQGKWIFSACVSKDRQFLWRFRKRDQGISL